MDTLFDCSAFFQIQVHVHNYMIIEYMYFNSLYSIVFHSKQHFEVYI